MEGFEPFDPYEVAWRDLRRRQRVVRLTLLSFLLAVGLSLLNNRLGMFPTVYLGWMPLILLVALCFVNFRVSSFPCPRCKKGFYTRMRRSDECSSCHLRVGEISLVQAASQR